MFKFLNKPVESARMSLPSAIILAILAVITIASNYERNSNTFGYYLLGFSILISITGFGMAFSKKERERARARVAIELPDRATLINAADADKIAQRRGFLMLTFGVALSVIWCWFFGFSSLAVEV